MLRPDRFIASCASWSEFWEGTKEIIARSFLPRDSAEDALDSLTEWGYVGGQPQFSGISQQDLAVTRRVLEKLYDRLRPS